MPPKILKWLLLFLIPIVCWIGLKLISWFLKHSKGQTSSQIRKIPKKLISPLSIFCIFFYLTASDSFGVFFQKIGLSHTDYVFKPLAFFGFAFFLSRVVRLFIRSLYAKFNINQEDNLRQRKITTQLQFIEKIIILLVWTLTFAFIFLSFEGLQKYGKSILASAGVISVVIGFAAQKSLGNLIAGFQIAFTQPIRLDDAVVIEGEWGWVEEITLTYIVIKIWDQRRLVLPITYIVEKPFQNWTRTAAQILGSVYIYVNYQVDIDKLRLEFENILNETPLWDEKVQVLQVVELQEHSVKLRALMSAKNSPQAWDLRCFVRERLIKYLQSIQGSSIPYFQVQLEGKSEA